MNRLEAIWHLIRGHNVIYGGRNQTIEFNVAGALGIASSKELYVSGIHIKMDSYAAVEEKIVANRAENAVLEAEAIASGKEFKRTGFNYVSGVDPNHLRLDGNGQLVAEPND